ncbi:MAG: phosphate ABC transporter permease PstA [Verrucomicrobiales bacterium]|nr:phosphate ABC transporter permease PstA [Verrucomicrobiales bacterium]
MIGGAARLSRNDRLLGAAGGFAALVVLVGFGAIVFDLFQTGTASLSIPFLVGKVENGGRAGGIGPVLISTGMILLVCLAVALPLGTGCAIWLSEFASKIRFARAITAGIDLLASVPSIVFGLFGMVFFCRTLGLGFSITSGGLTLACMILPIVIRTTLIGLSGAPSNLRPGAAALGLSRVSTIRHLLLPVAIPGVVVGTTLGISRALAETAALIFTSGYATRWPEGFDDSGRAISVHIYDLAMNVPGGAANAAASALVLLLALLFINYLATLLADRWLLKRIAPTSE